MASTLSLEIEKRRRLPTLFEVLSRYTLAPVDLFSFYIYMRDQQRSVDYLDFWLDVSQHMSLCRHYVRELRRSVLVATPEGGSRPSSTILENIPDIPAESGPSGFRGASTEKDADSRLSAFLRSETPAQPSPPTSVYSERFPSEERPPRPSFMDSTPENQDSSNSPGHTVARTDIRRSAEKILYTYLIRDSEREIILPEEMVETIIEKVERDSRDDPEVFDQAKDYVFQAMERDAFPGFLQAKALGNLVPLSILARLAFGLVCFWGAFWASFFVVLTDKPRSTRCWVILPFIVASYFVTTYQYKIDPVMALLGFSEYTFMNWQRIQEPYVRTLLNKRALVTLAYALLIAAALSIIFILVPGTVL
ncbi:Protein rax1 [Talaromyces islandicus]|uniref:Protein rax1 n=1 Tax=Talaromyces islandicus TaxID=28573 RepID=A0A0U1MBJ2_TALIS|nr:Protein rax1 [Talaromyces islandicus]